MPRANLQVAIMLALVLALAACGGAGGAAHGGPTLISVSPSTVGAGGPAFTLSAAGSGFSGSVVTWNGQALATTLVSTTQLTAQVPAALIATPGSATIGVTNLPFAGAVTSNTLPLTIGQPSALSISKSHSGNFVQGQTGAHYSITVLNGGSGGPTNGVINVTDAIPAGLTATALSGAGWSCDLSTVSCTRSDSLPAGSSFAAITVTVNVAANAPGTVTNSAALAGGGSTGGTATDVTSITPPSAPALTVAKSHQGNFTQGENGATYSIVVHNGGSGATSGPVTVTDTLPAGLGAADLAGPGWTCQSSTLTCTRGDPLAAGSSYPTITLTVNVSPGAPASVVNAVTVSGGGSPNSSANDPTTIGAPPPPPPTSAPALAISKTHFGDFSLAQVGATYTIRVSNTGTGPTSGAVTVADALPAGLTATGLAGNGWSCNLGALACMRNDALPAGSHYPDITLTVDVTATAAATVTNTATVSGGGSASAAANDPTNLTGP